MVFNTLADEEFFKVFLNEYWELAFRETPHIDQGLYIVRVEDLGKILFAPPAGPQCIYLFHSSLSTEELYHVTRCQADSE
jgi:hypothetical protein